MRTAVFLVVGLLCLSCIGCASTTSPQDKCVATGTASDSTLSECGVDARPSAAN